MATLYLAKEPKEGVPVRYVGVYVLRWRPEWGQPQVMFTEAHIDLSAIQSELANILDWVLTSLPSDLTFGESITRRFSEINRSARAIQEQLDSFKKGIELDNAE